MRWLPDSYETKTTEPNGEAGRKGSYNDKQVRCVENYLFPSGMSLFSSKFLNLSKRRRACFPWLNFRHCEEFKLNLKLRLKTELIYCLVFFAMIEAEVGGKGNSKYRRRYKNSCEPKQE